MVAISANRLPDRATAARAAPKDAAAGLGKGEGGRSPVSRILSLPPARDWAIISLSAGAEPCLRRMRLIPGDERAGSPSPVLSCTTRGLPCRAGYPDTRWALTPPFHPYLCPCGPSAVCSLLHFPSRRLEAPVPRFHEARCPVVSGLSSTPRRNGKQRSPGERRADPRHRPALGKRSFTRIPASVRSRR